MYPPVGLSYIQDAVPAELQGRIAEFLDAAPWKRVGNATSREVIHYGFTYDYHGRPGPATDAFPPIIEELCDIAKNHVVHIHGVMPTLNQCIINKYQPGQGIGAHIDHTDYGPYVCCFTFNDDIDGIARCAKSPGVMDFVRGDRYYSVVTAPGSLYIMSGPSRINWQHQMIPRKSDIINVDGVNKVLRRAMRISITFREHKE